MKKSQMFIIGIISVLLAVLFITTNQKPEFFDIFGIFIFIFLSIIGFLMFKKKKKMPDIIGFIILLIGILGLIVDGYIVIKYIILGG
jgi:uncharacterized membrane protein